MNTPVNIWDRLPDEHDSAWVAFLRYRDHALPRPEVTDFAHELGYPATRVRSWLVAFGWDARVLAWDHHLDGARQAVTVEGVEEMARRHIALAGQGLDIVQLALAKMRTDFDTGFGHLKAQEIARLLDVCSKLERLSKGQVTERVGADYSNLSDEDLADLERIAGKTR